MTDRLFQEALATPPPSTVDLAGIIRRERRRQRAQRLAAAACAGTALVTAGLLVAGLLDRTGPAPLARPPSPSAPTSAAPETFRLAADNAESAEATGAHLTRALDDSLHRQAPDATWIFEPDYKGESPGPDGQPPEVTCRDNGRTPEMCTGDGAVLRNGRKGSLVLQILQQAPAGCVSGPCPSTASAPAVLSCAPWRGTHCVERTDEHGRRMISMTEIEAALPGSKVPYQAQRVQILLADGRVLNLENWNDYGPDMTPAAQPRSPLTLDDVVAMASDLASRITA